MERKMKMSEKLFMRYEYLANKYASKIFSYEELSFEYDDLLQEFKIKIFTSIKAYGRRWSKYRKGQASRPVPLRYYLEGACCNKMKDFVKYIKRENFKLRIDEVDYDYGMSFDTQISLEENRFIINGIDLLEGLTGKERAVFSLFIKGCSKRILNKVYFNTKKEIKQMRAVKASDDEPYGVTDIIEAQRQKLISKYGGDLRSRSNIISHYVVSEDN